MTWIFGFFSLRNLPTPDIVPPVPIPQTKCVTVPSWFIISSLAAARHGTPAMILGNLTKGVFPVVSRMLSKTRIPSPTPLPTFDEKDGRYKNVRGSLMFEVLPTGFGSHQLRNRSRCDSEPFAGGGREDAGGGSRTLWKPICSRSH